MVVVCGMKKPTWIVIFISLQVVIFSLILIILNHDHWFYQKWAYNGNIVESFKGKLLHPGTSANKCTQNETYKQCYDNCEFHCIRFYNWYYAGAIYIATDSIVLGLCFINSVFLLMDFFNFQDLRGIVNVYTTSFIMVLILIFHFLALSIWAHVVKVNYGDCTHGLDQINIESVCAGEGFSLSVALLVGLGVVNPCYYLVANKLNGRLPNLMDESGIDLI